MRNIVSRLLGIGIVLGIGLIINMVRDTTDCAGSGSDAWFEATNDRRTASFTDYENWDEYTTLEEFAEFAARAEQRYQEQQSQKTISCLEDLHNLLLEYFRLDWKMYEAYSQGKFDLGRQYELESIDADEAVFNEFQRLAEKYDWDLEE